MVRQGRVDLTIINALAYYSIKIIQALEILVDASFSVARVLLVGADVKVIIHLCQ